MKMVLATIVNDKIAERVVDAIKYITIALDTLVNSVVFTVQLNCIVHCKNSFATNYKVCIG